MSRVLETSGAFEWAPEVPTAHRRLVETGLFDSIPTQAVYEPGELGIARRSGCICKVIDVSEEIVELHYGDSTVAETEIVSRDDVRDIQGYAKIFFEVYRPMDTLRIDARGFAVVSSSNPRPSERLPDYSLSMN